MEPSVPSLASRHALLHSGLLLPCCCSVDSSQQGELLLQEDWYPSGPNPNVLLLQAADSVYVNMWYAMAPAVSFGIFAGGALYWLVSFWALPKIKGYKLVAARGELSDGTVVQIFERHPKVE